MSIKTLLGFKGVVLPGLLFVLLPIFGVRPGESQESNAPLLRTTTSEVLLDFVVRSKHANIIRDLKPEEVQVFEDGVPQTLRHFEFYSGQADEPATASQPTPAPAGPPQPNAPAAPMTVNELRDLSVVSVVVGNLDPRGREVTVDAMQDFAKSGLGPNTYIGVFGLGGGGLRSLQSYTNDAAKVSLAVERAVGGVLTGQPATPDADEVDFGGIGAVSIRSGQFSAGRGNGEGNVMSAAYYAMEMHDVYTGSMEYLSPLRSLIEAQAQIPGRKVVLLFSAGILVHSSTIELLHSIISAANRANVSIYCLDTRGLTTLSTLDVGRNRMRAAANASRDMMLSGGKAAVTNDMALEMKIAETAVHSDTRANMAELTEGTGGAMLPDSLDLREPIREAIESARMHYVVTYAPANAAVDGNFRKIEVRVARPGARVFARSGYYAVPTVNGRQVYPFEMATLKAISTKPDLRQFDFHASTVKFRPGAERDQFVFVFQAPTEDLTVTTEQQWAKVHVCVTALVKDDKGEVVEKISKDIPYEVPLAKKAELKQGTVSFTAPFYLAPGHYTIDKGPSTATA
jgi:VWFA-related protein